ncbi:Lrp/AsnC family transcriptional regulator [Shimia thalassica]|uniref:Lrp/AsnC family transcriptional regulator n=1 Tax=Shimia thalassica TaxID=1715693 RepID=UPI001C08825C|nr:Lrp/AsnC family transcriptional regulator [Shimia thalassica]MBU2944370.1 Lrp/AsnC family transcriptional regulator [Shimia thalassica]MDO6502285.1 Lrp/AsnC family transcriptional regulator [Shimia thalassica]MDO6797425.1 Lrp/AsnC family transcriptional regulator [Shimia thalassica]
MTIQFDDRDRKILESLQRDSRISNADLAEKVDMSASALWRRVRTFEDQGLIARYGAVLDPEAAGLSFQAIVHVQLTRHDSEKLDEFVQAIQSRKEVLECFATTGQADYHMRVICTDLKAYNDFLENFLFRMAAVESAQTNVILRAIKKEAAIIP